MSAMSNFTSKRTDEAVLDALKEFMGRGDGVSYQELAERVGCSRLTALRAVARLESDGRVQIIQEVKNKPNQYRILD